MGEDRKDIHRKRKKRKKKKNKVLPRLGMAAVIMAVSAGGFFVYQQIPSVKADKCISRAMAYEKEKDYERAIASYEKALEIESADVNTYQYMANMYLDMDDYKAAEEILQKGVEETNDSQIQESYHVVMLNESVLEVNEASISFITVDRCLEILKTDKTNTSAYELLNTCYDRLSKMTDEDGINDILFLKEEGLGFDNYKTVIEKMISLYKADQNAQMKELLLKYIGIRAENVLLSMEDFEGYKELVAEADAVVTSEEMEDLICCLEKTSQIREVFAEVLEEFESGNYEAAREFIVSEEYVAIRDAFIEESMEYWEGKTYIPVSDIGIKLHYKDGRWTFSFVDEEKKAAEHGYIKVWGFKWLDNGHQRTAISYIPVSKKETYYPLTEYTMMYWWSTPINMELTEDTYARMNFRFEENTYSEEGKTTKAINDWGGKYEYRDIYE